MAFHALADYQNHVIGWLQWEQSSLEMGPWYDFREFGCHLGNVGLGIDASCRSADRRRLSAEKAAHRRRAGAFWEDNFSQYSIR